MESVATYPTIRLALRMILLTLVRKSELIHATWDEVDFESATWTIPKPRMKRRNPHVVYLSRQALDIFVALHTCAAGSKFVLPSCYDADRCMSNATLNRVTQIVVERAKATGLPLEPFTVHDLRRTGSTLLNEIGFNRDRSTTKPNTPSSGVTCCRSGPTWSMPGLTARATCRS